MGDDGDAGAELMKLPIQVPAPRGDLLEIYLIGTLHSEDLMHSLIN